jgi:NAD(P)-dependent dehydrogenase (short-subunit alcohol dehydrogenase family)
MAQSTGVKGRWALILGASSGFGEAIALRLAESGMNIAGVHLDRKSTLGHVAEIESRIRSHGVKSVFFNVNAADKEKRAQVIDDLARATEGAGIHCLVHSLAFGALRPLVPAEEREKLTQEQLEMTLDVMANSLVYWTQDLFYKKLLAPGGRIFAMTSSGSTRVWLSYGAVSAAKCALESYCRQLALELGPHGIAVNAIRAGVTDTPALRKIPGNERMIAAATERNPGRRLTRPDDVAMLVALLVQEGGRWVSGNVIGVDGGEDIVG